MKSIPTWSLFLFLVLPFGSPSVAEDSADRTAILQAIENFAQGADAQDAERIARSLHPRSWQFMPTGDGVRTFDQEQYLALIRAKKIGGQKREMSVESIDVTEGFLASARIELRSGKRVFLHQMSLMKVSGSWQILSILTVVGNAD